MHYTFQRSARNTYPLFNELSVEKNADRAASGALLPLRLAQYRYRPQIRPSARAARTKRKRRSPTAAPFNHALLPRYRRFSSIYTLISRNSMLGSSAPSTGGMLYTRLSGPKIWSST